MFLLLTKLKIVAETCFSWYTEMCVFVYWFQSPPKSTGSFLFITIGFSLNPLGLTFTGASNWAGTSEIRFMQLLFPFVSWWPKSPLPMTQFCHLQGHRKLDLPSRRISFSEWKAKDKKDEMRWVFLFCSWKSGKKVKIHMVKEDDKYNQFEWSVFAGRGEVPFSEEFICC